MRPAARAGATAVVAAAGLLLLASTGQTPSGFVPAALGGPLGLFEPAGESMVGVLSIGDGAVDANDLATLLKTTGPSAVPAGPLQAAAATTAANAAELALLPPVIEPVSAPTSKQALDLKPVLDSRGQVDCTKAVSCVVDAATNTTTVTFSDGVVAVVQKINDLTLVAYKTLGDVFEGLLPGGVPALPAAALPAPVISAGPATGTNLAPAPNISARPDTTETATATTKTEPSVAAGPVAPSAPAAPDLSASDIRPTLTISKPPAEFDAPKTGGGSGGTNAGSPAGGALDTVKGAVGSVVDAVSDAVKSLGPGAATTEPGSTGPSADTPGQ